MYNATLCEVLRYCAFLKVNVFSYSFQGVNAPRLESAVQRSTVTTVYRLHERFWPFNESFRQCLTVCYLFKTKKAQKLPWNVQKRSWTLNDQGSWTIWNVPNERNDRITVLFKIKLPQNFQQFLFRYLLFLVTLIWPCC